MSHGVVPPFSIIVASMFASLGNELIQNVSGIGLFW